VIYLGYNREQGVYVYRCKRVTCVAKFFVELEGLPE